MFVSFGMVSRKAVMIMTSDLYQEVAIPIVLPFHFHIATVGLLFHTHVTHVPLPSGGTICYRRKGVVLCDGKGNSRQCDFRFDLFFRFRFSFSFPVIFSF